MKSLGKQHVALRTYLNGVFLAERAQRRAVYMKADGTLWINWSQHKKQIQQDSGVYTARFDVRGVRATSAAEVIKSVQKALTKPELRK